MKNKIETEKMPNSSQFPKYKTESYIKDDFYLMCAALTLMYTTPQNKTQNRPSVVCSICRIVFGGGRRQMES